MQVAVVGAGLAGLACARALTERGLAVTVFDKGRSPGGRATSRTAEAPRSFDHGAQFFTARSAWLAREVLEWERSGAVARWAPRIDQPADGKRRPDETWWVGTPRMGALGAHLARGLDVRLGHTVTAISHTGGTWSLALATADGAAVHAADCLVLALPAPQAATLLTPASGLHARVAAVEQTPCWAVMVALTTPGPAAADLYEARSGAVAWAARENSKPGRTAPAGEELWTLHASTEWSKAHLEDAPELVGEALVNEFFERRWPGAARVTHLKAHRWRYARGRVAGTQPGALFDETRSLAVCGDWLAGERIEGALTSGLAAASALR